MYLTRKDIENYDNFQSDSEKETALFFYNLGLKCINLCFKITAEDGSEITDLDGIFLDNENKLILIYDDSTKNRDANAKISVFFNKCKQTKYEQQIYDKHVNLPHYPIKILYIDKARDKNSSSTKLASLEHVMSDHTAILFKDDFHYFKELVSKMGKWARNDLYNYLNIKLPDARIEVDAVKVFIGNTPAYLYAAKPHDVLKYAFVSRRRNNEEGYQRMVDFKRTKDISEKLINGTISGFMNSILLNSTLNLEEKNNISKSHTPANVKLIIANHFSSCKVVDGQHRLLSFTHLDEIQQSKFSIPVVLLDNLSPNDEKKMFLEINKNSKPVDPNLEYEIISDISNWEDNSDEFKIRLAVLTIKELSKSSPIKNNVYYGKVGENKADNITLKAFVDMLIRLKYIDLKSNIFKKSINNEKALKDLVKNIKRILSISNQKVKDKNFLISNRSIELILGFTAYLLSEKQKEEESDFDKISESFYTNEVTQFVSILNNNIEELIKQRTYGSSSYKTAFDFMQKKYSETIDLKENIVES